MGLGHTINSMFLLWHSNRLMQVKRLLPLLWLHGHRHGDVVRRLPGDGRAKRCRRITHLHRLLNRDKGRWTTKSALLASHKVKDQQSQCTKKRGTPNAHRDAYFDTIRGSACIIVVIAVLLCGTTRAARVHVGAITIRTSARLARCTRTTILGWILEQRHLIGRQREVKWLRVAAVLLTVHIRHRLAANTSLTDVGKLKISALNAQVR